MKTEKIWKICLYAYCLFMLALIVKPISAASPIITYNISPKTALSDASFPIDLLSYGFNCGSRFSHLQATVNGDEIVLSFLAEQDSTAICPLIFRAYGPSYILPALNPGKYKVYASALAPCMVQVPSCKMAVPLELVDTLVITKNNKPWFITPKAVPAKSAFTLKLLSNTYGSCQTSFSYNALEVQSGNINLSFVIENHPDNVCIADLRPFGPSFESTALNDGIYPVYVNVMQACEFAKPQCLPPKVAPQLIDTLIVSSGVAIFKNGKGTTNANPEFRNGLLTFNASQQGIAQVTLFSVSGKKLNQINFPVLQTGLVQMPIPFANHSQKGMYTVILQTPDGARKTYIVNNNAP